MSCQAALVLHHKSFQVLRNTINILPMQGFYTKVVPSKRNKHRRFHEGEAIAMSLRAATTFTLGFRSFYAFIPLVSQFLCYF